jgi:ribosomal protein S18 acetylase RimI-like enzyme
LSRSTPPEGIDVRVAAEGDLPGVESVARQAWHATYAGALSTQDIDGFLEAHYSQPALHRRLAYLGRGFIVGREAGKVIGFACLGKNREDQLELFAIYVLPDCQGGGVGSALWRAVEHEVRRSPTLEFHLWVLTSNLNASTFYAGKGGRVAGTRAFQIGDQEIGETRFEFQLAV